MTFPTLEELAQSSEPLNISEYGLKTEGIIELIRARDLFKEQDEFREDEKKEPKPFYDVPEGFVVHRSADIRDSNLRDSYDSLTSQENEFAVFLARSSHENEQPGKFETIPVLYDPKDKEQSFRDLEEAVTKVRSNPSKAVIIQKMAGELSYLDYESKTLMTIPLYDDSLDFEKLAGELDQKDEETWKINIKAKVEAEVVDGENHYHTIYTYFPEDEEKSNGEKLRVFIMRNRYQDSEENRRLVEAGFGELEAVTPKERAEAFINFNKDITPKNPVIGLTTNGFVARSQGYLDPNISVINSCIGLPTKLVNNPNEICILSYEYPNGFMWPISTGSMYQDNSYEYFQRNMDVFDVEKKRIVPIRIPYDGLFKGFIYNECEVPKGLDDYRFGVIEVLTYFNKKLGVPVEIEGAFVRRAFRRLVFFQLTKSHNLETMIENLSDVPEEQKVIHDKSGTIGSINFRGDVVIYTGAKEYKDKERALKVLLNKYSDKDKIMLITRHFRDDLIDFGIRNYVSLSTLGQVLNRHIRKEFVGNQMIHATGYLTSELWKRKLKGHKACFVISDEDIGSMLNSCNRNYKNRTIVDSRNDIILLKNVTVEATKGDFQVYYN